METLQDRPLIDDAFFVSLPSVDDCLGRRRRGETERRDTGDAALPSKVVALGVTATSESSAGHSTVRFALDGLGVLCSTEGSDDLG